MDDISKFLLARFDKLEERQSEVVYKIGSVEVSVAAIEGKLEGLTKHLMRPEVNVTANANATGQETGPVDNSVSTTNTITAGGNVQGVNAQSDGGAKNIAGKVQAIWEQNKVAIIAALAVAGVTFQDQIKAFIGIDNQPAQAQTQNPVYQPAQPVFPQQ